MLTYFLNTVYFCPRLNLVRVHFGGIEQGAVSPYIQFRKLDFGVYFRILVHENPYIENTKLVIVVFLAQVRVQYECFPDICWVNVQHIWQAFEQKLTLV